MKKYLLLLAFLFVPAIADAQTISACASGCTYSTLGAAITAATPGITINLKAGESYPGNFILPEKACAANNDTCYITIQTGLTAAGATIPESFWPALGIRLDGPVYAASNSLAKIIVNVNNKPAIETAAAPSVAKYWQIRRTEVIANTVGGNALILLGSNENTQNTKALVPHHFKVIHNYIHGLAKSGQQRGVAILSNYTTVRDNYISDIKSNTEGQSIWINNSIGPYVVHNNYMEGGTEGLMAGGSGGGATYSATITSPTTTGGTLSHVNDLTIGQDLSYEVGGIEHHARVTNIVGNVVTWSPASVVGLPDTPGDVDWGLNPADLDFKYNHVTRKASWRGAIVGTPQNVQVAAFSTGGTLATGNYCYRVTARHAISFNNTADSAASAEVCVAVTGPTGKVTASWNAVTNADTYRLYGRSGGGQNLYWQTSSLTQDDTGSGSTTGNVPTGTGTAWNWKNLFELKNMKRAIVQGNIFEYSWKSGQAGHAILFTPSNSSNANDSTCVEDVTFRDNMIRHAPAVYQLTGRDASGGDTVCPTARVSMTNNLAYDIGPAWGDSIDHMIISTGGIDLPKGPSDVIYRHNTVIMPVGRSTFFFNLSQGTGTGVYWPVVNFDNRDNILYRATAGFTGNGSCAQGSNGSTGCWDLMASGTKYLTSNVLIDANCSLYPAGNFCPTAATLNAQFVSYSGNNYRLSPGTAYKNAASDGTDIGANIDTIESYTAKAQSGDTTGVVQPDPTPEPEPDPEPEPVPVPPVITTATISSVIRDTDFSTIAPMTSLCNATPCTYTMDANGPTGVSLLPSGGWTGRPTVAGTYNPRITVRDALGLTGFKDFTIVISEVIYPEPRPEKRNDMERFIKAREVCPGSEEQIKKGDLCFNLTTGVYQIATETSPTVVWSNLVTSNSAATTHLFSSSSSNFSWSMLAAGGQYTPSQDIFADLTGKTECKVFLRTATIATGKVWIRYNTGVGATTLDLGTAVETPQVSLASPTDNMVISSEWYPIVEGAKTIVRLGFWGKVGVDTANPDVRNVGMICR